MPCPKCGRLNRAGAKRCAYCSAVLPGQPGALPPAPGGRSAPPRRGKVDAQRIGLGCLLLFAGFLCGMIALGSVQFIASQAGATRTATIATAVAARWTKTPTVTWTPLPTLTSTPLPTPTNTPLPSLTPTVSVLWRGDLHMHTTCSDGQNTYEEMVQTALQKGLNFIAITDHSRDRQGPFAEAGGGRQLLCNEVVKKCRGETRLLCIPGAEVTGRLHVLALGIQAYVDEKLPLKAQVDEIHRQGGLAIAAHPYAAQWLYTEDELTLSGLDAMECRGGTPEQVQRQLELSAQFNIPCVYNSDAHSLAGLGFTYNVCRVPIRNLADLKAALSAKKCGRN